MAVASPDFLRHAPIRRPSGLVAAPLMAMQDLHWAWATGFSFLRHRPIDRVM